MRMRRGSLGMLALVAGLVACGGGGGHKAGTGELPAGPSEGVAVDPYLLGAVVQELRPNGSVVQESSASDANGAFRFSSKTTVGNKLALSVYGVHSGAPYTVRLVREIDTATGPLAVTPLTTLLALGWSTKMALDLLAGPFPVAGLTDADLRADPMAAFLAAQTARTRGALAANLVVGAALAIRGGDAQDAQRLTALVAALAPPIAAALERTGDPAALASAAAAVATQLVHAGLANRSSADPAADVAAAAKQISTTLLDALVAGAKGGQPVAIEEAGGVLTAVQAPATAAAALERARAALDHALGSTSTDAWLEVSGRFAAARALADADAQATAQQRSEARFFGALARLASLAQPYSDGQDDGADDLGALLDAYGLGGTPAQRATLTTLVACQADRDPESCLRARLAQGAARTKALQQFATERLAPALREVVAALGQVGPGFTARLELSSGAVEFDGSDVLLLQGVAGAALAMAEFQGAYDLDADPAAVVRRLDAADGEGGKAIQAILADHPTLLRLVTAARVSDSRADAIAALTALQAGLQALAAETDDQRDDFISMPSERCTWTGSGESCTTTYNADAPAMAEQVGEALKLAQSSRYTGSDGTVLDVDRFFRGVDLRALLPVGFDAGALGNRPRFFPDATLGGVLVKSAFDVNADRDQDGSPDLFGISQFYRDFLRGRRVYLSVQSDYVACAFSGEGETITCDTYVNGSPVSLDGRYAFARNVLTLTFGQDVDGVRQVTLQAQDIEDGEASGIALYLDAAGKVLLQEPMRWWFD